MKSFVELNEFIDQQLFSGHSTATQRLFLRQRMWWLWATCLVPFTIFAILLIRRWASAEEEPVAEELPVFWKMFSVLAAIVVFILLCYGARYLIRRPPEEDILERKEESNGIIVKRIVDFLHPTFTYQPWNHITADDFFAGNLFTKGAYTARGGDMIYGRKGEALFRISSLTVANENEQQAVFSGNYFISQFPVSFHSPVFLTSLLVDSEYIDRHQWGRKILLNNRGFNALFAVYTRESILAVDLFTTELMQLLTAMQQKTESRFYMSFSGNQVHVAIAGKTGYFKGIDEGGAKSRQLIVDFYTEFQELLKMISLLSHNTTIWNRVSINE